MEFSISDLNFTLQGFETRAAFIVNYASAFKDVDKDDIYFMKS